MEVKDKEDNLGWDSELTSYNELGNDYSMNEDTLTPMQQISLNMNRDYTETRNKKENEENTNFIAAKEMERSFRSVERSMGKRSPVREKNLMHRLTESGDLTRILNLVERSPAKSMELQCVDESGNLPLHIASGSNCSPQLLKFLLGKTAEKTSGGKGSLTPLEMALNSHLYQNAQIIYQGIFPHQPSITKDQLKELRKILLEVRAVHGCVEILPFHKMLEFLGILRDLEEYGYEFAEGDLQLYYLKDIRDLIRELREKGYLTGKTGNYPKMYFQFIQTNGSKLQLGQLVVYLEYILFLSLCLTLTYVFSSTDTDDRGNIDILSHVIFVLFLALTILLEYILFRVIVGRSREKSTHWVKLCFSQDLEEFISGICNRIDTYTDTAFIVITYKCEGSFLGLLALITFVFSYGVYFLIAHIRTLYITKCNFQNVRVFHEVCLLAEFRSLAFGSMYRMCKRRIYDRDIAYASVWKFCTEDVIQLTLQILYLYSSEVGPQETFLIISSLLSGSIAFACMIQSIGEAIVIWNENHKTASNKHMRACAYMGEGEYGSALEELRGEEGILSVLGKQIYPVMAENLTLQGEVLKWLGRKGEMIGPLERAYSICEMLFGMRHSRTAQAANNLAQIYLQEDRLQEVGELLRVSYDVIMETYGVVHPYSMACIITRGNYLKKQGRGEESREEYIRALEIVEELKGPASEETALIYSNLSALYFDHFEDEEVAMRYAQKALKIRQAQGANYSGEQGHQTGALYYKMGVFAKSSKDYSQAVEAFRESIREFEGMRPPHTLGVLQGSKSLGDVLFLQGKYTLALSTLKGALVLCKKGNNGGNDRGAVRTISYAIQGKLGECYSQLGLNNKALHTFSKLFDTLDGDLVDRDMDTDLQVEILTKIMDTLQVLGLYSQAVQKGYQIVHICSGNEGKEKLVGETYMEIATILADDLEDFQNALQCGEKALAIFLALGTHLDTTEAKENIQNARSFLETVGNLAKWKLDTKWVDIEQINVEN